MRAGGLATTEMNYSLRAVTLTRSSYLGVNIIIHHRTESRLGEDLLVAVRVVDVINLGEQKVRHGGQKGSGPADQRDQAGSSDVGQGEDV